MGPRIREDNGRGWIPVCVFTGAGCERGDGDGSPHPRGQREGDGLSPTVFTSVGCERENGGIWTYLMTSRMMCPDEE